MARKYPTYCISKADDAKNSGVFITRNIPPRCIARIDEMHHKMVPPTLLLDVLEWWDEASAAEMEAAHDHMLRYAVAHKKTIVNML